MPTAPFQGCLLQSGQAIGLQGEMVVARFLEKAGYTVSADHRRGKGDLTICTPDGEILYIEVKTARKNVVGKYNFTLCKRGKTNHRGADFVVLLCVLRSGDAIPFVVPVSAIRDQQSASITSFPTTYTGRFAPYRQTLRTLKIEGN